MKAIVTGGSGLIGRSLVSELLREGWEVDCLGRKGTRDDARIRNFPADFLDSGSISKALQDTGGGSVLFHLGAVLPAHDPPPDEETLLRANVLSSLKLFEAALDLGIARVVNASSISVIGMPSLLPITEDHPVHPLSSYAISKLASELHAERLRLTEKLNVISLRVSSCYGPGMNESSVLPLFVKRAREGRDLTWLGSGSRTQNFVHVVDVVRAFLLAAGAEAQGVFHVGADRSISMKALAELVARLLPGTASAPRPAGRPDPREHERWDLDLHRARTELGYAPSISLDAGLPDYIASCDVGRGHSACVSH